VAALVLGLFAVAVLRAVQLQVVRASGLQAQADDQRQHRIKLLPARGKILDRNLRELAVTVPGASVFVDPSRVRNDPRSLELLIEELDLDPATAWQRLEQGSSRFAWLKRGVTPREAEAVQAGLFPGAGIAKEPRRYYPKKALAGQVLGFVGVDGKGLGGIEYRYDPILRGRPAAVRAERDARGSLLLPDAPDPSDGAGRSVVLTLDQTIQHIAEEELAGAVEKSRAKGGIAIVIEPDTGDIFALAQVPAFNPNALSRSRPEDRKIEAVVDVYEPGSTFKVMFLGILLDRGIARTSDLVFCENGSWRVHDRTIHDHAPHGWLSVADVLKVSSNIGVAKLSEKIAPEALYRGLREFGIGTPTDAGLPGESAGILPPLRAWSKMTPKTVAYGQGVSTTILQMASAVAAVGNGGLRMKPRFVRMVVDEKFQEMERIVPEVVGRSVSEATAATLTELMETVVHGEGGTGALAAVPGYLVAGKTGTSWKSNLEQGGYHRDKVVASFLGFAPSKKPRVAILVAVDEPSRGPRYGGAVAAPAFREITRRTLAYLQVPPEGEGVETEVTAVVSRSGRNGVAAAAGTMPDVRGLTMREALRGLEAARVPIRLTLLGSGLAVTQDPVPGTRLVANEVCRVVFRSPFSDR
jgi:cell division protein FtsI (penicillin-binding protein 3)